MEFSDTSHGRLAWRQSDGAGLPVLMIHGNSTCTEVFRNQLDGAIGEKYRCIAFDLPGHGQSSDAPVPEDTYSFGGYANAAVELMAAIGVPRYAVFGWSLGGHIALDMLAETDALAGLIISGSAPISQDTHSMTEGFKDEIEWSLASKRVLTEDEIHAFAHGTCGPNAPYDPFLETAVRRCDGRARSLMISKAACGLGRNQQDLAINATVPLAIVNGADDAFINHAFVAGLPYRTIWEGAVIDLPDLGHAPFWEAPETFDPILNRFLSSLN
ncbi:MAG: alpha/beta hydrolase [Pseudomonadota bacterium]